MAKFGVLICVLQQYRSSQQKRIIRTRFQSSYYSLMAEGEGFEPPDPCRSSVFKTDAIDHSANLPYMNRPHKTSPCRADFLFRDLFRAFDYFIRFPRRCQPFALRASKPKNLFSIRHGQTVPEL